MSTSVDLHVVIVNYDSASHARECITSMSGADIQSIILLDNASSDAGSTALTDIARLDERVRIIQSDVNLGFAGGVNAAVCALNADDDALIWILNPDTRPSETAPAILARAIADGTGDIVSPLITTGPQGEERIWFAGGIYDSRRGVSWHWHADDQVSSVGEHPIPSPFITGAAPMMSMRTWKILGGMRDDFFLYWEDTDFSMRALSLGLQLMLIPEAVIWHKQGGSTGESSGGHSPGYYYYGQRNRLLLCETQLQKATLVAGSGIRETARLLLRPIFSEPAPRGPKLAASLRGIRDGIRGRHGRGPY